MGENITLFPDQKELVDKTREQLRKTKSVLVQSATGSGKTIIATYMIAASRLKGTRSLFVVPRRTLLSQTAKTLDKYGIPFTYFASGYNYNSFCPTILGSAQTMATRMNRLPDVNIVFVDETHYGGATLEKIIEYYRRRGVYIVGLSATPTRLDGKGLGDWYESMVEGQSIAWLIENKRLSGYRMFAPNVPDLSGIKTVAGDYSRSQLSEKMEQDSIIIGNAVTHYQKHCMGKLGLTFCTSRKHSQITAQAYRDAGIPAAAVDGTTPDAELKATIRAFARREILQLVNCDLLTFGFDLASAAGMNVTVETMHDLQPTKSLAKQMQEWGRVLRYEPGKTALIFDHAGNWLRHDLPDEEREWSLEGIERRKSEKEVAGAIRQCPKCHYAHRPTDTCPNCGHVYEVNSREVEEIEGELQEINREALRKQERKKQGQAKTLEELIKIGYARGYKPGKCEAWARQVFAARSNCR